MLRDDLHEQRLLIRHPLQRAAEHRIEARVAEAMDVTGGVADPQLDGILAGVAERESLAVGGPRQAIDATARGSAIGVSCVLATSTIASVCAHGATPYPPGVSCLRRVRGSTRTPASLRNGSATCVIGGYLTHDTSRIESCVGLTTGCGGDGACSTSSTYCGGLL